MITISAFKMVPPFAQGVVRDLRVRWALEEAGLPYKTMLIDPTIQGTAEYRALQPFGQVPIYEEDGLACCFYSFVVFFEEPILRKRFGSEYEQYCAEVPRWLLV
jgi:Glutathione S-transferase, N-terminal domain